MGTIKTTNIEPIADNGTVTLGSSGDTVTVPSGCNFTNSGTATGFSPITVAQQWRLNTNLTCSTTNSATLISSNIEQTDTNGYAGIGSAMSVSSGIFTFPVTGIYLIKVNANWYNSSSDYCGIQIQTTTDNSSYGEASSSYVAVNGSGKYANSSGEIIFDVTDTSTHKIKFMYLVAASTILSGHSDVSLSYFNFLRLGDT
jgi:hypothetical protein